MGAEAKVAEMAAKKDKKRGKLRRAPELARVYEGIEILDALLHEAGAEVDGEQAIARLAAAIAERRPAAEVIPSLFPEEPHFAGSEYAMRLYGNLFGVWDLLLAGRSPEALGAARAPTPPPPEEALGPEEGGPMEYALPARGSIPGEVVPFEVVEGTWQMLQSLPERERARRLDRYENSQSELAEWARSAEALSDVGLETLEYLCFELAQMFDQAFGARFGAVPFAALEAAAPAEVDRLQPYAVDYLEESLDEAEEDEEEEGLPAEERATVEELGKRAIVAMTRALRP